MKLSEFWTLMNYEFTPAYSPVLARDLVLSEFDNVTAQEALDRGEDVRSVWVAICDTQGIPVERRWGPDISPKSAI